MSVYAETLYLMVGAVAVLAGCLLLYDKYLYRRRTGRVVVRK